ncbi:MAG TPA: 16S rRNA (adenine(1518)-N(6)/adenine(1519)-N(6))-dimethyltransferase RsmA [Campylobacterales bacterium]|nr:16S rRNA (adenine(1518)-N(6)/adenine(1519)-N(6))-dimethyltransferase RsmA [Campylobacterales bacterium]
MQVVAKKKFGQNFLKDDFYLDQIIQSMPDNNNKVLEIGPGLGDLTGKLLAKKAVVAVEVDTDLISNLESKFKDQMDNGRFLLLHADILTIWDEALSSSPKIDIVANLPYYIATNIVLRAIRDERIENIIVMVQKEVAEKFCATPKSSDFGAISVICDCICQRGIVCELPPSAFEPAPKVFSAVLKLVKRDKPLIKKDLFDEFEFFLKHAFSAPRKTLLKNLSNAYLKERLVAVFEKLEISLNIRPHELTTEIFASLFTDIKSFN